MGTDLSRTLRPDILFQVKSPCRPREKHQELHSSSSVHKPHPLSYSVIKASKLHLCVLQPVLNSQIQVLPYFTVDFLRQLQKSKSKVVSGSHDLIWWCIHRTKKPMFQEEARALLSPLYRNFLFFMLVTGTTVQLMHSYGLETEGECVW
jgi:hypothetical protein